MNTIGTPVLYTIGTQIAGDREFSAWNDGHVEIEDPLRNFQEIPTLPNISLTKEQALALRDFLNNNL